MRDGDVTVPPEIRERLGIEPGDFLAWVEGEGQVTVCPIKGVFGATLRELIDTHQGEHPPSVDEIAEVLARHLAATLAPEVQRVLSYLQGGGEPPSHEPAAKAP